MAYTPSDDADVRIVIRRIPIFADLPPLPDFTGAACAEHPFLPPETWDLIVDGESVAERQGRRQLAAQVCSTCPIRDLCDSAADDEQAPSGVWAGRVFNPRTGAKTEITVRASGVPTNPPAEPSVHEGSNVA